MIDRLIVLALAEDIGSGDITAEALLPPALQAKAHIIAQEEIVGAGLAVAQKVFAAVDPSLAFEAIAHDGEQLRAGSLLATVKGSTRSLLTAERTALNFLQHLSGIATLTKKFIDAVHGTKTKILDTRKTLPGFRLLEKEAVRAGGGVNHRMGLYDRYLIKNNHIAAAGGVHAAVAAVKKHREHSLPPSPYPLPPGERAKVVPPHAAGNYLIEVECRTLDDVREASLAGVDWIMLDNMDPETVRRAVELIACLDLFERPLLEASGNITLENVRAYAEAGVDFISVGKITHSAPAADIHMILDI